MNLKELQNKKILLFGKSRAFSMDEFASQLKFHKIEITSELDENVALVVDAKMMTPYEQNRSDALYESHSRSVEFTSIDEVERELAKHIDANTLLMSLKLSRNKERLKSFLQNSMIDDTLFFKLLKMYSWSGEDFFENDDNRDVSAALISRFYENIERNHNVQYATTGILHLIGQTKNRELLKAISLLEPIKFHPKIECAIAMSLYCDEEMQEYFFKNSKNPKILEALSLNKDLKPALAIEFLKDEELGKNVAKSIKLTDELFELCKEQKVALALNETLTPKMQEELLRANDEEVCYALSLNGNLDKKILNSLLQSRDKNILSSIYANKAIPIELLEDAYRNGKYYEELAKNESTPIEILYQLQLDSRYERFVKTNAGFGKHIQQVNIGWEV
ncbi:hypothetical protein [Sulfurimonas sp.]|jgi:hypothetical protein|uniref:hypothetical protein n=1 Tax=Sulfurimonas sp. TaxID=2022749 RepID=UPI0025E0EBDB|nr:hypothetical protein [Sulfurimonas sp.]MCK9473681.1 hypothetical protein [Sulfurimonas sp.]